MIKALSPYKKDDGHDHFSKGFRCVLVMRDYAVRAHSYMHSGDSRIKKVGRPLRGQVGGQHKCRFCIVIVRCFEDQVVILYPINLNMQ